MGTIVDTKESRAAQNLLQKSKEAFAAQLPRKTVKDVDIFECVCDETFTEAARFVITGSVATVSPTGKTAAFPYRATVDVKGKEAALTALEVSSAED